MALLTSLRVGAFLEVLVVGCGCADAESKSGHGVAASWFSITCSTVVLQCYRRQAIPMEQAKIRP